MTELFSFEEQNDLAAGLETLVRMQHHVSRHVPGAIPPDGFPADKDAVRTYFLALMGEVYELLQTLDWKPWKLPTVPERHRIMDEYADVLAFLGIITTYVMRAASCDEQELAAAYQLKSQVNLERIAGRVAGYGIQREHEDEATIRTTPSEDQRGPHGQAQEPGVTGQDLREPPQAVGEDPRGPGRTRETAGSSWPVWPKDQLSLPVLDLPGTRP